MNRMTRYAGTARPCATTLPNCVAWPSRAFLATIVLLLPGMVSAASYYAAPNGTGTGDGSIARPWDLQTALNQPSTVHPGDTIWLRGGTYRAPTSNGFTNYLNGTSTSPIVVRNYNGERATIDGRGTEFSLAIYGSYTWFWGLEVMDSNTTRSTSVPGSGVQPNAFGVAVYAPGTKCINMIVHDTAEGFSGYDASPDSEFSGNISYYNGWAGPDRQHGHGMYFQNVTGTKIVADNIVGDNFDEGIQIYGSGNSHVQGFRVRGNALYNTSSFFNYQYNLVVGGGGLRSDIQVTNNYSYFTPSRDAGFIYLGQYTPGQDLLVQNNVFAGGYLGAGTEGQAGPVTFTGNTVYVDPSSVQMVKVQPYAGQSIASYTWDNNTYYGLNRFVFGTNLDFNGWTATTGFDANSTYTPNAPTGTWVYVRPNAYEGKRANVTIYNWNLAASVGVDLSGVLSPGDAYVVRDAQNFFGSPVLSGTYSGGTVNIPMTGLSKVAPIGIFTPPHTAPQFGTFVVMLASGSISPPATDTTPPSVSLTAPAGGTVSGSIPVTASASDIGGSGVAGVQFKLDGNNLGSQVTAPPYTVTWNTTQSSNGIHSLTAVATDVAGNQAASAAVTVNVNNIVAPPAAFQPIRVNAGGAAYTDTQGHVWSADFGYSGSGGAYATSNGILGTSDLPLYQSERWTWPGALQYQFTVPAGNYTVNLKFDEIYATGPGQRVFNILINGQTVLSNFDIFAQAGGAYRAIDKQFTVSSSGNITIQFAPVVGGPKVNAIEILQGGSTPPSSVSVSLTPGSATLSASQTQQFTAAVTGSTDGSVRWSLNVGAVGTLSAAGLYTAPSSIPATQPVTVTATSNADPGKSASATITLQPSTPPVSSFTPIRVNAGGSAYTDSQGHLWSADFGYSGTGGAYSVSTAILGAVDQPLYQTERWTWPGALQYQFTTPAGNYTVNLKFAEIYATGPGQRIFNIVINGQTVLSNFDIFAQVGAKTAIDKQFTVSSSGNITIQFAPVVGGPKINAIEIF